jgi:predicted HD phosphohydrolase
MDTVKFRCLSEGDREDFEFLEECDTAYASNVGERLIQTLASLENAMSGFQITRLEHCLQSTTRAWFDGADIDWIVSTLLHDIGDIHAPYDHDEYAALILRPFVREQCTWTVKNHGDFQKFYFAAQLDEDPHVRDQYQDEPYFDDCVQFCELWDQKSFDPAYTSLSIDFFSPFVMEVFNRKPYETAVIKSGERVGLTNPDVADIRKRAA